MSALQATPQDVAHDVLETAPFLIQLINGEHGREPGSSSEAKVLSILTTNPGVCLSTLAVHLRVSKAHASVLVERLVRRQLVQRTADREDSRRIVLAATRAGEELLHKWRQLSVSRLANALSKLPEQKLHAMREGIDLVKEALSDLNR